MKETAYKVYPFRWLLLAIILPVIVASEVFWLSFAPITTDLIRDNVYHVNLMGIDLFSLSYMLMYIVCMVPASWVIDKYGFKASLLIGAALTAVFGVVRFFFAGNYTLVLVSQFLLAAGQPFLVNISTKVPANWFPVKERSTAAGLLIMAQYLGFIIPMVASPRLYSTIGLQPMLGVYAAFAVLASVLVLFARERPPVPPGPEAPREMMTVRNVKKLLVNRSYLWVLVISFISMGLFNTLMTKLEGILTPRGFTTADAGILTAAFVVAGIVGAVAVPAFSDRFGKRVPLFIVGIATLGPLCLGLTFFHSMPLLLATAALMGFVIMGLAPVLFQHGAEVAYPVPEGTSFGFVMLAGQVSGILFVVLFDVIHEMAGSLLMPMLFLVIIAALQIPFTLRMKESELLAESNTEAPQEQD